MAGNVVLNGFEARKETMDSAARMEAKSASRILRIIEVYVRIALGAAFLSALADRFGLWGPPGRPGVSWGDFAHFTSYAGMVNSFLPARIIPAVAWAATIAESAFGVGLILGVYKRLVALGAAILLLLFASAMAISFGVKTSLDYSVFGASAAAFLLFAIQEGKKSVNESAQKAVANRDRAGN